MTDVLRRLEALPARVLVALIEVYRVWVSPMLLPSCRFSPTCSAYAAEAISTRGAVVGTGLSVVRILKCAPWHSGGWDPVPAAGRSRRTDERGGTGAEDKRSI